MPPAKYLATPAAPKPFKMDAIEIEARARSISMLNVLEAIALNPLESGMVRRMCARDILEFGYGKPTVRIVQEIKEEEGQSNSKVIEHVAQTSAQARRTKEVTEWARKQIPFDLWPKEVQDWAMRSITGP